MLRHTVVLLGLAGLMLGIGCVKSPSRNYFRLSYPDHLSPSKNGVQNSSRFEIPPPVKSESKTARPRDKLRLSPFHQPDAAEKANEGAVSELPGESRKTPAAEPSSGSGFDRSSTAEPYRYVLKFGDSIVINLRGVPNVVPIQERVDENGHIKLDYIGSVYAQGKTAAELEDDIEQAYLDQKIYRNLSVSVQLPQKSYFIRGEVLKPGRFSLLGGVSIVQAIATAGGFNDFANPKDVLIIRGGKTIKVNVRDIERNPSQDLQIEEGDVIVVKRSFL